MAQEIVILTKSKKWGGHCVAGVDTETGEWVRLVSSDEQKHGALTDEHLTCEDDSVCQVLDCVKVKGAKAKPIDYQPENVLIDEKKKMKKVDTWSLQDVLDIHPAEEWETVYGNTERALDEEEMDELDRSLILIKTPWLRIKQKSTDPDKPKTRANFLYNDQWNNNISVTDREYFQVEDGTTLKNVYLVVSLPGVPHDDGKYYKFIAKIFQ